MKNLLFSLVVLPFFLISCGGGNKSTKTLKDQPKKLVKIPDFNADSAYYFVQKQVDFGPRTVGSESHEVCAKWLVKKFNQYSDTVIVQPFKARTYDNVTRNAKNIIASINPENPNRLLLMAHWDTRPFADHDKDASLHNTAIDGANDGASGVGVLLEMARLFKKQKPEIGVDIVLFDLEDWGPPSDKQMYENEFWGLGSQYWSKTPHTLGYTARYGILLDMVGAKNPKFLREGYSDRYAGFVMNIVWNTAAELGYGDYFLNQQGYPLTDDHYFVNTIANIPSIDIIHMDRNSSNGTFFEHWHTTHDTMDKIDKKTLKMVGHVVSTVVYNE
ncbi:MAG: glutamine cyclotransferase [Marinilabiliales bacterium]|nr:MAG: glutamine cyclotransferase [Marinilabiliales bacterium]